MKLHWSPRSPFVRKVMVCAHEIGLADRIERIRSVVAMMQPNVELMRVNPLSRIPALLTDDGQVLFESVHICEYLDSLHDGPRLFPRTGPRRWEALRWHALGEGMMEISILWRNERIRPEARQSTELLTAFDLKIRASLDFLEREAAAISRRTLNIGHIAIGCALGYLDFRFPDVTWRERRRELGAWFETFSQRPSMQQTFPVDE